jgi:hypothetical protein
VAGSAGIDRRALIKGAAVAGAAAWTAPMIIDSLASPAAAASQKCTFKCSAVYVYYSFNGSVYYTAFQNGQTGCNHCKAGTINLCQVCGGNAFYGGSVAGSGCGSNNHNLFYTLGAASCPGGAPTGMTQALGDASCASHVILSADGHTLSPGTGVALLGAFAFSGGSWFGACPDDTGNIGFPNCSDPC